MSTLSRIPPPGPPQRYSPASRAFAEPEFDDSFELRQFVRALLRRKRQILLVALLVAIPVAVWTFLAEPLYRSSALVNVDPDPVQVLPYREVDRPSLTTNYELFMKSQDELLKSPILVSRLAERLRNERDAAMFASEIPRLSRRVSVERIENTQIFRLSYVAPSPESAARVANLFADEYIKRQFEAGEQTRQQARLMLQRELQGLEERVQQSERELVAYAQKNRLSPTAVDNSVQQKHEMIEKQTAEAEGEVFAARSRLGGLQKATVAEFPQALVTPVISGLVTRQLQLEHDLSTLRGTFGENWPAVAQKRDEVALVRDQLTREKGAALAQARDQATLDYLSAENKRRMLSASLADQQRLVNMTDDATIEFNILRREVETNQKMYEGLLERLRQASVSSGVEFGGFRVVEPATPSLVQDSPKVAWNLLLASFLGLALGGCIAIARDYWDMTVSSVEEVERLTQLPVLASVPVVAAAGPATRRGGWFRRSASTSLALTADSSRRAAAQSLSSFADTPAAAEAVRNLCASILLSRPSQPPRVLLVTSTQPGEGKSTIARELAAMIAERGPKTLLVECDLRRPTFSTQFAVGTHGGLSLWLAGVGTRPPKLHDVAPNLSVVVSGPHTPNPVVLLDSDRMKGFLSEMLQTFQFVVLDAPPVMGLADARVLAPMADGVVLVVRAGAAQKRSIDRACSLLESAGANVIGAVLNGAELDAATMYYYRDYFAQSAS